MPTTTRRHTLTLAGRRGADAALLRVAAAAEGLIAEQQQLMKAQP